MWETIKNDPILKTITIIILSVLGFGFAFNIMFGANRSGMGEMGEMSSGYSLENTLSYILAVGIKLLLIALVIAAIVAVFKLGKKILGGEDIKMINTIKKDPVLKWVAVILAVVLTLGLIHFLFGNILGFRGGNRVMVYGGYGLGIAGIMTFLLKFLLFLSVVGVIIGVVMYIKQNYSKEILNKVSSLKVDGKSKVKCSKCGAETAGDFKFCPSCGEKLKDTCESCGIELKSEWKCCPGCGAEKGAGA